MNAVRATRVAVASVAWLVAVGLPGCTPTIKVAPPDEPIVINMNIKIEHEIRVKVDKDLDQLFEEESEIF